MKIASHITTNPAARNCDSSIIYVAMSFVTLAIAMLYFASSGPGLTEAELAMAAVFP